MIPILYDKTGNAKITNLTDCIQCIVTEERNGMFEAELVYSVHSNNSDKLIRGNIIVADANDTLKGQKFRIYKVTKPINGRIKILARHISFDMARDVVTGLVIDNQSCEYALNKLFSSSQFSRRFIGHSDIVNSQSTVINGTTHILKAIVGVEGSIIDTYGTSPEILRDNYDFYIYENRGHDNGVTIEYGKNLTGLNLDTDDSNMITRIRAVAKYRDENQEEVLVVSSPEFIDSPYINNYETPFIQEIDFSSHFKDDDIPTPIRLKTLAENYFANNKCDLPSENATISFIPLSKCVGYEGIQDKISLCDTVTVIDYRYNLATKVKVIKVSYNTLKERYENMEVGEPRSRLGDIISNSMNTVKGEKGDKGDKGDKGEQGAPGNIGDFPDNLPATPILSSSLHGFASIELSWTFESQPYYTYELYASKTQDFTPNEFDLLFEGKGSTFLFQAKPNETWYFRVRAVNSHGRATSFSSQVTVTTTKIDDLSNYVENAAIGEALIGTLSLDRGWVGTLKGNYIDAKQLSVTDGNGKRTLFIDSFGNVSLDVTELKISSKKPATAEDIEDLENKLNEDIEDLENKFNEDIEKITVTERNLVKNSAFLYGENFWYFGTNVTLDNTKLFNGHPSCKSSQSGLTTDNWRGCANYNLPSNPTDFKKGETYTFSCYYYAENKTSIDNGIKLELKGKTLNSTSEVTIAYVSVSVDNIIENNWTRISNTITLTQDYYNCCIRVQVIRNGTAWFTDFKLEKNNKVSQWTPAFEDNETYVDNLIVDLQTQLDGKIETYSQNNDPSTSWTATEKANHVGDIWYNTSTKNTYRWNGNSWVLLENAEAQSAKEIAQTKAQVFTGQPTTPYYKGDIWITSTEKGKGIVKTCITTRTEGSYTASDWVENLKYTDDTLAEQVQEELNNLSIGGRNFLRNSAGNLNNTSHWNNFTLDTSEISTKGWNSFKLTRDNYVSGDPRCQAVQNIPLSVLTLKKGENVTLSGWIYVSSQTAISNGANNIALRNYVDVEQTSFEDICGFGYNNVPKDVWARFEVTSKVTHNTVGGCKLLVNIEQNGLIRVTRLKLERGNKATDWTPAPEDTDTYIDNLVYDLQNQLDGKIETYSQSTDPSTNWTTVEKPRHEGDIWYNTSTKSTYRWSGTAWVKLSNQEAIDASNLASTKAQVFIRQPITPYYKGDLWVTALDGTGVVKTCITTRTSGDYVVSDWVESLKYTDDTFATQLQEELNSLSVGGINLLRNGSFENGLNNWAIQDMNSGGSNKGVTSVSGGDWVPVGKKALQIKGTSTTNRYGVQSTEMILIPNTKYTISGYCAGHRVNALQINVRDLDNGSANIHTINVTPVVGGATLDKWYRVETTFTTTSNTRYVLNLYAVDFGDNGFAWFEDFQVQQGTKATAWTPCPEDTDTYIDNLVADLQGQLDGKVQTYAQNTDPSTSWTTAELKTQHAGDIWYDTNNKTTYRWNGNSWVKLNNKEAEEASELAKTKAQVFTSQPTVPYKKGDLWVTALDGTGIVKTCIKDRTSGNYTASEWVENLKYTDDTLAEQVQGELDNLTIGGRNFIRNSAGNLNDTSYWSNCTLDTSEISTKGWNSFKITRTNYVSGNSRYQATQNIPLGTLTLKKGEYVTLSGWIYVSSQVALSNGANNIVLRNYVSINNNEYEDICSFVYNNVPKDTWTYFEVTSKATKNTLDGCKLLVNIEQNGLIKVTRLKLEKGNKATDWTSAPEDTNSIINDAIKDLPTIDDVEDAKDSAIIASKIETIKQSYNVLKSEYNKNIQQSEIIYKNSYLEGTAKTNLNTAITNYKTAFTSVTSARDSIVNANTITTSQANAWNTAITNIQTSTDTLAKRVQEAQTYIDTAIYNASVDYTDKAIPDALTGYAKTSYVDDAMEQAVNDAKDGMVSSTDLTLNNEEILLSAASMGQYNLLRNSDFRNGLENWTKWGVTSPHTLSIVKTGNSAMNGENNAHFSSLNATVGNLNIGFYQEIVLVPGSTYTLSYWVNCANSTIKMAIVSRNGSDTASTLAYKNYTNINGTKDRNTWKFDSISFVVPSDSAKIRVAFSISNCTNASYNAYLVKPMLVSGNKAQAWTGHPDEIYVGVVSITEKKGLMVEHSNANTKTIMSADGFSIEDNNGDVLAWLSSKDQWTELKADKVFANNVENVYEGDSYLYVDHSKTVAGDGTANSPFNSFAQLKQHLETNPVINIDILITVKNPGFIIHEQLRLDRLKGTGFIKITLEDGLVIANEGSGQYCIRLHQIPKWVWIVSNRTFGSSTTGAVLQDGTNVGTGNGIFATDVERLEIDNLTIACSNFGIHVERTWVYTYQVDFGKSDSAVDLAYQSRYVDYNSVGSTTKFCVINGGSFAYWGNGTVRPMGDVREMIGLYYDHGNSLAATASPRYPVSNPTPPPTSGQIFTKTYNCTSKQSYQYNWSNWSTDGSCKAGAWGYGLRGGHMFFNMATIRSEMTGTIQDGNTITLTRANSGGISGDANVYINGSNCSSASGTPNYSNNTHLGTLKWGETKTFTLPKAIVQSLINGTCNSLAVYVNSTASNNYINITNASITLKTKK